MVSTRKSSKGLLKFVTRYWILLFLNILFVFAGKVIREIAK